MYNENTVFKNILRSDTTQRNTLRESVRAKLTPELRQFVTRFVVNMTSAIEDLNDYDDIMDAYAELAIREAKWVGLPIGVLKNLDYILADDCFNCNMVDLVNSITKLTNKE